MIESSKPIVRFHLLDALRELGRGGAAIEASLVTTFTYDAAFYEEVLLRAFERAGSRLNIVFVDARQLAASLDDPLRQPTRAGKDYLLVPVSHATAFHPKILALLSEKSSVLSIGSHNTTDPGFSHNEEVTSFWGPACKGPPRGLLLDALEYCLFWLRASEAAQGSLLSEIEQRIRHLGGLAREADQIECHFLGTHPESLPLWTQTGVHIPLPVRRVCLVGPYFDKDLRTLNRISEDLNPDEIIVGLQPGTVVLEAPDAAPIGTRFVDAGVTGAFRTKAPGAGFAHGKAMLFETDAGAIVCLGSANPTGAGWLGGAYGNAEANVLLTGAVASRAATELGLDALIDLPPISAETLQAVASRSREERHRELEQDAASKSTPVIVGVRRGDAIVARGVDSKNCRAVVSLQGTFEFHSATFAAIEGGVIFTAEPPLKEGGLIRIDGFEGAVAIVVVNDEQAIRDATRPKVTAKLLEHLGRLDSYDGFDEIFDLLQRHVFDDAGSSGKVGTSKVQTLIPDEPVPLPASGAAVPFGPRGISVATIQKAGHQNHLLENGLVSEVIAALIRAIGPVSKPVLDGDGRNLDADDARPGELSADDVAQSNDADLNRPDVDWPRLVTACRKRISVMINRLREKVDEPIPGPERAAWLFNRVLLVLCLLRRLRSLPPASNVALDGHRRPASLVGVNQLREAFKLAMQGLYGRRGIARLLETSPAHRGSGDRAMLDDVLLWTAHETGADYEETSVFNEQPAKKARRLGDRADVVVVSISAAAHLSTNDVEGLNHPASRIWEDATILSPDWLERHRRLGAALQSGLSGKCLPTLKRKPKVGEFAFWVAEPGLPRLVQSLSGDKVTLFEPGADDVSGRKIVAAFLDAIDLDAIVAASPT